MLATQLCHRQTCLALFQYCHDLAFGKPAFLQGSLHIREAPKFYRLTSTHRGSLRQSATWPSDKVERITGKFYSWGKKSFYLGDGTLVASNNGYEWAVVDGATTVGEEFFDIGVVLFLPGRDGKIAQVSFDGTHFSELSLSGAESGYWNHFATSDMAILATFSPSRHETFLRLGSIQMAPAGRNSAST